MSTSLLYHAFGIRGYKYEKSEYEKGSILFYATQEKLKLRCSICLSSKLICRGTNERRFRCLPIGKREVIIVLKAQRVFCELCHNIRQVKIPFANERVRYTKAFERYALELLKCMTIQDVAKNLNVSWDTIKEIDKRYLIKHFSKPKLKKLKQIAIDEISVGKGHRYFTVVLDLRTGAIVFVGDSKGTEALKPFWKRLKRSRASIKAVATDMGRAYIKAVKENLPMATLVCDHFHVIKLYNDQLSKLRRKMQNDLEQKQQKDVLKGTRWLLLKNPENLNEGKDEKAQLQRALELNKPLAIAYYLKDDLKLIWKQADKKQAEIQLVRWVKKANSSGEKILKRFSKTLLKHKNYILAYYDYPISTGPLEGTNNKIKTLQRRSYGFRDLEFYKLKILAIHRAKYALVG